MHPTLLVSGLVERESRLDVGTLRRLPSFVDDVSALAPGAVGSAVRVADILDLVPPSSAATHCTVISRDGSYRASIPLDAVRTGGWLAIGIDGDPLPPAAGGPLRLTVAEGTTLCWNVKAVGELHLAAGREADDVPENPPH